MEVCIYVEGGGDRDSKVACRIAFSAVFGRLGLVNRPKVVACGGRDDAYKSYCLALRTQPDITNLLLVDSESVVEPAARPDHPLWHHVIEHSGRGWRRPRNVGDECLFLMVQCTEAWLVADLEALTLRFGKALHVGALRFGDIEAVSPVDLLQALKHATRDHPSPYVKRHAFDILAKVQPEKLRVLPHGRRLIEALEKYCHRAQP